ncbi:hypothetical protein A3G55_00385 [Candidatus Giovannonibacteria bacterium RIFCSPLOWO2_12_FULL_44_25]|uniref:DUF218 domain-containing protein n=2 Tax=Candidatus Giovannoniibacteriota TaxID=1752738 RepID=A0A1F5WBH8_9BACT|nr:MAG: hypothetical protein UW15_C0012G0013 [Parcubacteria group bacterium GW2011_GWC1_44_10]KKT60391.1 MAG: hypothetical protein UW53_C0001G0041 [Candidatus Giovannonibacteria bacterium GW2011_GWA1_44_25]KKU30249.1 MAG: hypothetical protein UX43_C0001G0021 [Candidatus Giovannonibacteria bacterium GW2011_GWB1_46_20]OGF50457.1 MAG: hypothetical protein A2120_02320 [Candidatus Giovannonibacteria bacterium GWA2_45_15]OGF59590.1 MAG: hypothetical protein A2W40_04215 [Candidatus Giovannonibacteria 
MKPINIIAILGGGLKKDSNGKWRTTNYGEAGDKFGTIGDRLRVVAASHLYKNDPRQTIICLGGKGQLADISGVPPAAEVIRNELVDLGVAKENIITETNSGNTFKQLNELNKIIQQKEFVKITILSNGWHLPRTKAIIEAVEDLFVLRQLLQEHRIVLSSAEEIVLEYDRNRWEKIIADAYSSEDLKRRIELEGKGVAEIESGVYKYSQA